MSLTRWPSRKAEEGESSHIQGPKAQLGLPIPISPLSWLADVGVGRDRFLLTCTSITIQVHKPSLHRSAMLDSILRLLGEGSSAESCILEMLPSKRTTSQQRLMRRPPRRQSTHGTCECGGLGHAAGGSCCAGTLGESQRFTSIRTAS